MDIYHLVYTSRATVKVTDEVLQDIRQKAVVRNPKVGVTGILLYSNGHFLQLLEGPAKSVASIYARISQDERHDHILCLFFGTVEQRMFPGASMGVAELQSSHTELEPEQLFRQLVEPETIIRDRYCQIASTFERFRDQVEPASFFSN